MKQEEVEDDDEDEDDSDGEKRDKPPKDDRMGRLEDIAEFVSEYMINENPAMKVAKHKDTLAEERNKCFNTYMCTPYPRGAHWNTGSTWIVQVEKIPYMGRH